ncbi:MAG: hypothetical protein ACMG6H_16295, partial [Acidobacteriota bacterium]
MIKSALGKKSFVLGERVSLMVYVANTGAEVLPVADPRRGGDSLHLRLRLPDGQERAFTTGEALQE